MMEREEIEMEGRSLMNIKPNTLEWQHKDQKSKAKVVVIMGATGTGKSRLAIDLASHLPIEIINADSMQVYRGLDVLTNKVSLPDQKGVPHHLLGTISPNVEFTSKDFRDHAIPIIDDILSRNRLPVIVGGTNFYIQALVSPFLLDESVEDMDDSCSSKHPGDKQIDSEPGNRGDPFNDSYDRLKDLDPVAANRIHPNDHRKINQYLSLYARSGVLPSKLFQQPSMENWGRVDNFRYDFCFICVDASPPVLDRYVEQRVDCMVDAGLLNEVFDIYNLNADYTKGLRQAIGVREFKDLLGIYFSEGMKDREEDLKEYLSTILGSSNENQHKQLLTEAIDQMKANTRRLVRRQKRRLNRLQILFGWNIHYVDATQSLSCMCDDTWRADVVEPALKIVRSHLNNDSSLVPEVEGRNGTEEMKLSRRDLWTQYVCKACGNRVLRGAHEWEQHKQGRGHRKRVYRLKKTENTLFSVVCTQ